MKEKYNSHYYEGLTDLSLNAAREIIPLIIQNYPVSSVIDLGCGNGAWLKVCQELGITNVTGYDINELSDEDYLVSKKHIRSGVDFSKKDLYLIGNYDLLLCLELVEHLPKRKSDDFIHTITNCAPVILFSAAIPGQTGKNHINEQPPRYWRNLFHKYEYVEIDFLRPLIWKNPKIIWWYRQNITLFVNKNRLKSIPNFLELSKIYPELAEDQNLELIYEKVFKQYNKNIFGRITNYFRSKML